MGTEVLHPQDCLRIQRIRVAPAPVVFNRRKSYYYGNGNGNGNGSANPRLNNNNSSYRKVRRSPEPVTARRSDGKTHQTQVTILKRGESVDSLKRLDDRTRNGDVVYGTAERIGPSPAVLPKQIRFTPAVSGGDTYAGSAFSLSPSPRALPLPSFFSKKPESHDSATEGLRRLLRLE